MATEQPEESIDELLKKVKRLATKKTEAKTDNKDVSKALALFKSSKKSMEASLTSINQAIALLEGKTEESDEESQEGKSDDYIANLLMFPKPADAVYNVNWFGRKKDGTPKAPSGKLSPNFKAKAAPKAAPKALGKK